MIQQSGVPLRGPPGAEECKKYTDSKDFFQAKANDPAHFQTMLFLIKIFPKNKLIGSFLFGGLSLSFL